MRDFEQDFEMGVAIKLHHNFWAWHQKIPQSIMTSTAPALSDNTGRFYPSRTFIPLNACSELVVNGGAGCSTCKSIALLDKYICYRHHPPPQCASPVQSYPYLSRTKPQLFFCGDLLPNM